MSASTNLPSAQAFAAPHAPLAGFLMLMLGLSWAIFHRAEQDA